MSQEVLDLKLFKRFSMILKGKASHHIDMLADGCSDMVCQIKENKYDAAIFSAHKLKSSSAQMGAKALSSQIGLLELGLAGEEAQKIAADIAGIETLIAQTVTALREAFASQPS